MKGGDYEQLHQMINTFDNPESLALSIKDLDRTLEEMPLSEMETETVQQMMQFRNMLSEKLGDIINDKNKEAKDRILSIGETPEDWFLYLEEPEKKKRQKPTERILTSREIPKIWDTKRADTVLPLQMTPRDWLLSLKGTIYKNDTLIPKDQIPQRWRSPGKTIH